METIGFEMEARLRREIAALQERVASLLEIQVRAENYRRKVLEEYNELELENKRLKTELRGWESDVVWQPQPQLTLECKPENKVSNA